MLRRGGFSDVVIKRADSRQQVRLRRRRGRLLRPAVRRRANADSFPGARSASCPSTGKSAFESSSSLTSVRMPKNVSQIGRKTAVTAAVTRPLAKPAGDGEQNRVQNKRLLRISDQSDRQSPRSPNRPERRPVVTDWRDAITPDAVNRDRRSNCRIERELQPFRCEKSGNQVQEKAR